MQATATAIFDWAKGEVVQEVLNSPQLTEAKQTVVSHHIQGRLAKYNALYERVQSIEKNLRSSVEGLRSLLSYEKENIRENKFANQQS